MIRIALPPEATSQLATTRRRRRAQVAERCPTCCSMLPAGACRRWHSASRPMRLPAASGLKPPTPRDLRVSTMPHRQGALRQRDRSWSRRRTPS
jgi:hypothetical protein